MLTPPWIFFPLIKLYHILEKKSTCGEKKKFEIWDEFEIGTWGVISKRYFEKIGARHPLSYTKV